MHTHKKKILSCIQVESRCDGHSCSSSDSVAEVRVLVLSHTCNKVFFLFFKVNNIKKKKKKNYRFFKTTLKIVLLTLIYDDPDRSPEFIYTSILSVGCPLSTVTPPSTAGTCAYINWTMCAHTRSIFFFVFCDTPPCVLSSHHSTKFNFTHKGCWNSAVSWSWTCIYW